MEFEKSIKIIKQVLNGNKENISLESFENAIKIFVINLINTITENTIIPICNIKNLKKGTLGIATGFSKIELNKSETIEPIYNGERLMMFCIFHELVHISSTYGIATGVQDDELNKIAMEYVINRYEFETNTEYGISKSYFFSTNYKVSSAEAYADKYGAINTMKFFDSLKIKLNEHENAKLLNYINNAEKRLLDDIRYVGGNIFFNNYYENLTSAVTFIVESNPEYLEVFPQLKIIINKAKQRTRDDE